MYHRRQGKGLDGRSLSVSLSEGAKVAIWEKDQDAGRSKLQRKSANQGGTAILVLTARLTDAQFSYQGPGRNNVDALGKPTHLS